jgi:hypothetical protein
MQFIKLTTLTCLAATLALAEAEKVGVMAYGSAILADPTQRPVYPSLYESSVNLVGVPKPHKLAPLAKPETPKPVIAFDASLLIAKPKDELPPASAKSEPTPIVAGKKEISATPPTVLDQPWVEPPMPDDAVRPDTNGVIITVHGVPITSDAENPWDIRAVAESAITEHTFYFSGNILGIGNPVCYINNAPLIRGDKVGLFNVAYIRREEVILERNGHYYVIPIRKKTTVRLATS